jgi:uncharacterized protein YbcI
VANLEGIVLSSLAKLLCSEIPQVDGPRTRKFSAENFCIERNNNFARIFVRIKDMKKNNKIIIEKLLPKEQINIISKLNTPNKIQDFLDSLPFNFEKGGETYMSPLKMLRAKKAHCFEGAVFSALCLTYHNFENFLIDLKVKDTKKDSDHVISVFVLRDGSQKYSKKYYGATSKTNHSILRFRDPIYKSLRELVMSYYNEYYIDSGEKTLFSFSKPFDIWDKFKTDWIAEERDLDQIAEALDESPHIRFVPPKMERYIRKASKIERKSLGLAEWTQTE